MKRQYAKQIILNFDNFINQSANKNNKSEKIADKRDAKSKREEKFLHFCGA